MEALHMLKRQRTHSLEREARMTAEKQERVSIKAICGSSDCDEQPLSPAARLFHEPRFNCYIVAILGSKTSINPEVIKAGLAQTLVHHPRFSSIMVKQHGKQRWVPTKVNIEDHITVPKLDPNMAFPDLFLEDYVSALTQTSMDTCKPLWELHLLNVKTSDAEAVGVFKIHHSIGDGASLISLLLACTRKSSDPEELPSVPVKKRSLPRCGRIWWSFWVIWLALRMLFNTFVDVMVFLATCRFLKDSDTPIKGGPGVELKPKRFVHKTFSLDDIKLVKNAMDITVNDVLLGVTQAGLSQYLNRRYVDDGEKREGEKQKKLRIPENIRVRAAILANIRPAAGIQELADMMAKKSRCRWGNEIGCILLPFSIALQTDPLDYVRKAKATIDRKKLSLEVICTYLSAKLLLKIFGAKATADLTREALINTTMAFSNVVGPLEEVSFCGHSMAYLAPSVYGHPQALTIHYQSYIDKMTVSLGVDPNVIPDPHRLCDDIVESLELIKVSVIERGFYKPRNPYHEK